MANTDYISYSPSAVDTFGNCETRVTVQTCGDLRATPLTEGQPSTEFALQPTRPLKREQKLDSGLTITPTAPGSFPPTTRLLQ